MPTIIQGLKRIKHLNRKIETTKERIRRWCSYMSDEVPVYDNISALIQSASDMQTEIANIRHAMHVVNAITKVTFQNKETTLDELLLEATVTIPAKLELFNSLRRKEKNPGYRQIEPGVSVVMQYDPADRDKAIDALTERLDDINAFLDMMNIQLKY
jgi:hypothetical protein